MKYTFDSRQIEPGDVFVALKGEKADGHDFIPMALAKGAAAVVDGLEDLHRRALAKRRALKARVIGVTGSAGKTTTKELLKAFLARVGKTFGTEGNFNNHIGLPLTILNCPDDAAFLVLEMGTNHPGEIAALCAIAEPEIGLVTGIGTAHLEFFKTRAGIAAEKGILLARATECGVFPAADDFASVLGGLSREAIAVREPFALPASFGPPPPHFAENAALAFAVAARLGCTRDQALAALENFSLPGARWRKVEKGGVTFIDDTYNANPDSMTAALSAFAAMPCRGRRLAVLGDMFELGDAAQSLHEKVFAAAREAKIDFVWAVGEMSSRCPCAAAFPTATALSSALAAFVREGDLVLLKASHGMKLGECIL